MPALGDRLVASTPIATLGAGLLALFLGFEWFWIVFVVGFAVLTPLVAVLFGSDDEEWDATEAAGATTEDAPADSKADALETLRDRYARGELSEAQFERKLERLLGTETLEDARRLAESDQEGATGRETATEREP